MKLLANTDQRSKLAALSRISRRLLPDPGISQPESVSSDACALDEQLMSELQSKLGVKEIRDEDQSLRKAYELLSSAYSSEVMTDERRQLAADRMGHIGLLKPSAYRIVFRETFARHHQKFGIRKKDVEEVVRHPDNVVHLLKDKFQCIHNGAVSVYVKTFGREKRERTFTLLVETRRQGLTQVVHKAWRIYHADVDLVYCEGPIDILRAFVDRYGVVHQLADHPPTKFTLFEEVAASGSLPADSFIQVVDPKHVPYEGSFIVNPRADGVLEVSMAYAIDTQRYLSDLRRHGVR